MRALRTVIAGTAIGAVLAGCSKDAQTDAAVTTDMPGAATATSMSGDSAEQRGVALVRVVNAALSSSAMVVRSDDTHQLPTVEFKKVSVYTPIDDNWVTFQVRGTPTAGYEPLETNRELLTDGNRYTLVVLRDDGGRYRTRILRDEISSDQSQAFLRVIHAASGVDEVDIVAEGKDTVFKGVNFTSEAGFKPMAPWSGTLEIRSEDGGRLLHTLRNLKLEAGKSYTVVLTANAAGAVESFWFEDAQT